uniref:Uncharacterized protein n=1 Tax=mine drainage metagenome TaxID=410659 RepID=E6PRX2_9ZZZZ
MLNRRGMEQSLTAAFARTQRTGFPRWLRQSHLHAQLERHAATDPLTSLLNRRGMEQSLTAAFARTQRTGFPRWLWRLATAPQCLAQRQQADRDDHQAGVNGEQAIDMHADPVHGGRRLFRRRHLGLEPRQVSIDAGGAAQLVEFLFGAVARVQRVAQDAGLGHAFHRLGLGLHLGRFVLRAAHGVARIGQARAQAGERFRHAHFGGSGGHLGFHHLFLGTELLDAILQSGLVSGEFFRLRRNAVVRLLQRVDFLQRGLFFGQRGAGQIFALGLQRHAGVGLGLVAVALGRGHLVFQRDALGDHVGQVALGVLQRGDHFFVRQVQGLRRIVGAVEEGVDPGFQDFGGVLEHGHGDFS